jgi:hypothetical protein
MKINKNLLILSVIVFSLSVATVIAAVNVQNEVTPAFGQFVPIISRTGFEATDKDTAPSLGIKGYFSIDAKEAGEVKLDISSGTEVIVPLVIRFISYDNSLTEAKVHIDPQNPYTLIVEQVVEGGTLIRFNDFVKYDITGDVTVKAGVPFELNMSVKIPAGVPHFTSPLYIVGIESDYQVICNVRGDVIA